MKFVLILTALAAAGVLIFVLAHEDDAVPHLSRPGGSELHADPAKPNRDTRSSTPNEANPGEVRDSETLASSNPTTAPDSKTGDATSSSASPGEPEELVVRVFDRVTKEALPGVEVFFASDEDLRAQTALSFESFDQSMSHAGRSAKSDEDGRVRFPAIPGLGFLFARTETRAGFRAIQSGIREMDLDLGPYAQIPVRVVDAAGRPQGRCMVLVRQRRGEGSLTSCKDDGAAMTSEGDGVALLDFMDLDQRPVQVRYSVALHGLFETPVEVPIDLNALPDEPITLVMPDCGSLSVSVTKGGQSAIETEPGIVIVSTTEELERRKTWEESNPGRPLRRSDTESMHPVSASDRTVPRIGLGLELTLAWTSTRYRGPSATTSRRVTLTGPTRPGEVVPVVFELPEDKTIHVRGRILEKDGYPNAQVHVTATLEYRQAQEETAPSNPSFTTDADGRFEFQTRLLVEESRGEPWLVFRRHGSLSEKVVHEFRIDPKGEPEIDLGDLILFDTLDQRRQTILAAGRVVDEEGRGLAMTQLSLKPIVSDAEQKAGQLAFSQTAFSGEDGSFQFRATARRRPSFSVSIHRNKARSR